MAKAVYITLNSHYYIFPDQTPPTQELSHYWHDRALGTAPIPSFIPVHIPSTSEDPPYEIRRSRPTYSPLTEEEMNDYWGCIEWANEVENKDYCVATLNSFQVGELSSLDKTSRH